MKPCATLTWIPDKITSCSGAAKTPGAGGGRFRAFTQMVAARARCSGFAPRGIKHHLDLDGLVLDVGAPIAVDPVVPRDFSHVGILD